MLRRETIQTWAADTWSFLDSNNTNNTTEASVDANPFLSALQLQDLFGQDVLDNNYYDEMTFVPEQIPDTSNMLISNIVPEVSLKRRRHSSSSSSSSSSNASSYMSSEEDDGDTFSALYSYMSSDSEHVPTFLQRRQMEEMIMDKITNQLDPEKLPGILTIISSNHEDEAEEVEIDLAVLKIDQLTRILAYVDACLLEKNGGPKVKLVDYTAVKRTVQHNRNHHRRSIVDEGHIVDGSCHSQLSTSQAPMASLTEYDSDSFLKKRKKKTRKENKNNKNKRKNNRKKEKTATKKSKKKSAIHKRRLLEEMIHPQNNESDDEDEGEITEGGNGIIIFGNEQMDFAVTQNQTIEHQEPSPSNHANDVRTAPVIEDNDEEDDELIDIML